MNIKLEEQYKKEIIPALKKELGCDNTQALPHIEKVVLNVGVGKSLVDPNHLDAVLDTLRRISGQEPIQTRARKSISNFKIREGLIVGAKVTMRGPRMFDFLNKFIHITLPRVRDFRGLSETSVDKSGNLNIGITEHIAFPEVKPDEVERIHGLEVAIVVKAKSRKEALVLLKAFGIPFKSENK